MTWTVEAIELLKTRAAEGLSASQIAAELNDRNSGWFSRNAVIGKCGRKGIALTGKPFGWMLGRPRVQAAPQPALRPTEPCERVDKGRPSRIIQLRPAPHARVPIERDRPAPDSLWITIEKLRLGDCRFPRGTPGDADFAYCGAPAHDRPYCPYHRGIAYETVSDRKKEREMQCRAMG